MMQRLPANVDRDARHRALDLSFVLLADDEQWTLRLLGLAPTTVFYPWMLVALWSIEDGAPIQMAMDEGAAWRLCERLANVRLLEQLAADATGVVAFRVLEHVRDYARALWRPALLPAAADDAEERLDAARRERRGRSPLDLLREHVYRQMREGELNQSLLNARGALSLARELVRSGRTPEDEQAERLALAALAEVLAELGGVKDAEEISIQAMVGEYPAAMARALRCRGRLLWRQRALAESVARLATARSYAQTEGDGAEEIRILREMAIALAYRGELAEARSLLADVQARDRTVLSGLIPGVEWARSVVELEAFDAGEEEALERAAEAAHRAIGWSTNQRLWRAWGELQLVRVERRRQRHPQARSRALSTLDEFVGMRHRYGAALCRWETGRSFLDQQRHFDALPMLEEAREIFSTCGDRWVEASVAVDLARALHLHGRLSEADRELALATRLYQSLGPEPTDPEPLRAYRELQCEITKHLEASRRRVPSLDLRLAALAVGSAS
jgi:hypothetical protein